VRKVEKGLGSLRTLQSTFPYNITVVACVDQLLYWLHLAVDPTAASETTTVALPPPDHGLHYFPGARLPPATLAKGCAAKSGGAPEACPRSHLCHSVVLNFR
jgi:hypothetical protein